MKKNFAFLLLAAALLFLHLFQLTRVPGFHFDEAWAANFSYRIFSEKGFWPLTAMSPYTAPWAHYGAALFFKLFGVNLFVFRFSQLFFVFSGLLLLCFTLHKRFGREFALYYLLCILVLPGLVLNHRFAIEINGFHVFCFGLLVFGASAGRPFLVLLAAILGTTSHILFLAPVLALLGARLFTVREFTRRERCAGALGALALFPFFLRVHQLVPEKGKALALLILCALVFLFFVFSLDARAFWKRILGGGLVAFHTRRAVSGFVYLVLFPFLVTLFFFSFGIWSLWVQKGIAVEGFVLQGLALFTLVFAISASAVSIREYFPAKSFFMLCIVFAAAMMLKAAPRYYEIPLLLVPAVLAFTLQRMQKERRLLLLLSLFSCSVSTYGSYFIKVPEGKSVRFLFWKDDSRDFLSKQILAEFLGRYGCAVDAISSDDPRVNEALRFLAHGDWPINREKTCPYAGRTIREDRAEPELAGFVLGESSGR